MDKMAPNEVYPTGSDLVWLGRDRVGRLAAFITAGAGQIPKRLLVEENMPCDFEGAILDLPKVSDVMLHVDVPRPDSFIALAERGLFVFDWRDIHRATRERSSCYELVATPLQPTRLVEIAPEKRIPDVLLYDFDFSAVTKIRLRNVDGFVDAYLD